MVVNAMIWQVQLRARPCKIASLLVIALGLPLLGVWSEPCCWTVVPQRSTDTRLPRPRYRASTSELWLVKGSLSVAAASALVASLHRGYSCRFDRVLRAAGRSVSVNLESRVERNLRLTSLGKVDALLTSEGLDLMVSGAESSEPADELGKVYCYMPVLKSPVPGIRSTQMRLTCSLQLPRSGLAILKTDEFANLLEDEATGVMQFDETWSTRGAIRAEMTNTLAYRQVGQDLNIVNSIRTTTRSPLPDWFPIPETVFNTFVQSFVRDALKSQQLAMLDKFEQRCSK